MIIKKDLCNSLSFVFLIIQLIETTIHKGFKTNDIEASQLVAI